MGYFGKIEEKQKAQQLRKEGYSYNEILSEINVSKDTISRWCRSIELTQKQKERLVNNKIYGQKKGSIIAASNKRRIRHEKIKIINYQAKKEINFIKSRDKFIAGISLYAGEGSKTDGQIGFSNSNPTLIKFMMDWFLTFAKIFPLRTIPIPKVCAVDSIPRINTIKTRSPSPAISIAALLEVMNGIVTLMEIGL